MRLRTQHMGAADEGGQPLDLVDETLRRQEFERAIDRRRCGGLADRPQPVEQVIGARGAGAVQNEPKNMPR